MPVHVVHGLEDRADQHDRQSFRQLRVDPLETEAKGTDERKGLVPLLGGHEAAKQSDPVEDRLAERQLLGRGQASPGRFFGEAS